ncbi:hypothetical protein CEXT_7561 [Caerostris extrusa]|uniref:Uncharacterized protein n=1 Tax=Caerostris extrusa TaxID=172846 RepID=A0AAV4W312_CAEEX|nr:hypothetical protein CEXT_7561 [Caerostris extrusa]
MRRVLDGKTLPCPAIPLRTNEESNWLKNERTSWRDTNSLIYCCCRTRVLNFNAHPLFVCRARQTPLSSKVRQSSSLLLFKCIPFV